MSFFCAANIHVPILFGLYGPCSQRAEFPWFIIGFLLYLSGVLLHIRHVHGLFFAPYLTLLFTISRSFSGNPIRVDIFLFNLVILSVPKLEYSASSFNRQWYSSGFFGSSPFSRHVLQLLHFSLFLCLYNVEPYNLYYFKDI